MKKISADEIELIHLQFRSIEERQTARNITKIKMGQVNYDRFYNDAFFTNYATNYVDEINWFEANNKNVHKKMTSIFIGKSRSVYFQVKAAGISYISYLLSFLNPMLLEWLVLSGVTKFHDFRHLVELRTVVFDGDLSAGALLSGKFPLPEGLEYIYLDNITGRLILN
jgi:hypothetical protein